MKKILAPISVILILIISCGIFFLTQNKSTGTPTNVSPIDGNGNRDVVQYAIDMDNFSFTPNFMRAEPGKDFKIKLTSKNGSHRFVIDKLNFDSGIIVAGESKTVTISIPSNAKGEYEFHCAIGNHKDMGMTGKLQIGII